MPIANHAHDVEHFDWWSRTYEQSWMPRALFDPVHSATLTLAASLVHQPTSVLDVGCGTGKLLRQAMASWPEAQLIGVDPADGMIAMAQRLMPNATFLKGTGEALPLQDVSVDLALSTISFHHWHDQAAGVREIARVLCPGGYFLLADMSFPAWLVDALRLQRVHSHAGLQALFQQARLRVQAQQRAAWPGLLLTVGKK